MDIHLGFEPDAARGRDIDRRMNLELAASLRYVLDEARTQLSFDQQALLQLVQSLESGQRVSPFAFSCYYDLVGAMMDANAPLAASLLNQLAQSHAAPAARNFVRLADSGDCEITAAYLDKFVGSDDDIVVKAPSTAIATEFIERFERGMDLMHRVAPELAGEVDAIVHDVIPIVGDPSKSVQIDGGSHYQLWGALFLNADFHPTDEAMLEVIAHESAHSLLFGLCTDEPLVLNDDDERYASPLRTDLRPMDGIFHATFVSARMHWAMTQLLRSNELSDERKLGVNKARDDDKRNFESGLAVVREHGRLTGLGSQIMAGAQRYMAAV